MEKDSYVLLIKPRNFKNYAKMMGFNHLNSIHFSKVREREGEEQEGEGGETERIEEERERERKQRIEREIEGE